MHTIRMSHLGFLPLSVKKFVYLGEDGGPFTVDRMMDGVCETVYTGELVKNGGVFGEGFVGDFSAVTEPGVYRLFCGEHRSRIFYIYEKVYDAACRMMTEYFVWQRCGDPLGMGWNGCCHREDKLVDRHGKTHILTGGHHQSGDLRKWGFGAPNGIYGLSEYRLLENPRWNRGTIEYDIAHSARYYLSRISDEGYLFDCTFVPEDYDNDACFGKGFGDYGAFWRSFLYLDTPSDAQSHFVTARMLASAALSLRSSDPTLAEECLAGGARLYNFMHREGRYRPSFDWKIYPPIGHVGFKEAMFDYFQPDSAHMLCGEALTALALYRASGEDRYRTEGMEALRKLQSYMVVDETGVLAWFRRSKNSTEAAEQIAHFPLHLPTAFAEALALWPEEAEAADWRAAVTAAVRKYQRQGEANLYGITTSQMHLEPDGSLYPTYCAASYIKDLGDTVVFLTKAAGLARSGVLPDVNAGKALDTAGRLLDMIIGANPGDASCIEGVGYNQPFHALFGEYFPSQPQIPGGVFTDVGWGGHDADLFGREYDMPVVGSVLLAFAAYSHALAER